MIDRRTSLRSAVLTAAIRHPITPNRDDVSRPTSSRNASPTPFVFGRGRVL